MITQNKTRIGLTQFIDFTIKGSNAKITAVRKIKSQDDYHPAFDYWKQLREGIVQYHKENRELKFFETLIHGADEKKRANYSAAVKQYKKFLRNKDVTWFDPGKAIWTSDELTVRSSPELGLVIDGVPHLVKLYFKGKTEKVDKRNTRTILTLLNTSQFDIAHADEVHFSVLNIHKNNFISSNEVNADHLLALESEATQFMHIWERI